jgi:hypothetical protein
VVTVCVKDVESEEQAIEAGMALDFRINIESDHGHELDEFEPLERMTSGNVNHFNTNEAYAEEV